MQFNKFLYSILFFLLFTVSCKQEENIENIFNKKFQIIEDYLNEKEIESTKLDETVLFLEKITGIKSNTFEGIDLLLDPKEKNLLDWKNWYAQNKGRLYIDKSSVKIRFKEKKITKHAKGFEIQKEEKYIKLIISTPFPDAVEPHEFYLVPKNQEVPKEISDKKIIRIPIEKVVVTSTTHIPMLEALGIENKLIGFPNLKYISSEKTYNRIQQGEVKELGKEQSINTEVLLSLQPDAVIGFAMNSNSKMFTTIERAGIPVILNGDWLETTPIGRAEWIKFFGVLFEKEKQADSIFNNIVSEYNKAKALAEKATSQPNILSGVQFKDIWNLPAGESFVAQFLKDANTNYLWQNTKGKGSLQLSFESVFDKAQNATFWLAPGHYTSFTQLKDANQHYTQFDAFKNKTIFTFGLKKGVNGGTIYYERAPLEPQIVLKDIIKIVHPELLPNYTPFYLEKLID